MAPWDGHRNRETEDRRGRDDLDACQFVWQEHAFDSKKTGSGANKTPLPSSWTLKQALKNRNGSIP